MKYSEQLVWKAIYEFNPNYKKCREANVSLNLPTCLKDTAVQVFLEIGNNAISSLGHNRAYAAHIVQDALKELQEIGWMTFGDVEEYWM